MRYWIDEESGVRLCEPDCVDEWLFMMWATGCDYDSAKSVKDLKALVDELVRMSESARECLHDGKLFSDESKKLSKEE